jgi:hypothetical protein
LEPQIRRNVEAYIDNIVVKSKTRQDLIDDLKETFDNLHKYKMKLNPKKCVFIISSGKLLSYMMSTRGIDANPKKVEAIEQLQPLQTWWEIHKLAGMMTALSWFISKSGEYGMPFYKLMHKADDGGVGVVLMQSGHPFAFISKAMGLRTRGLLAYVKEYLAILIAIDQWRSYL